MRRSSLFLMLIIAIAATFLLSGCGQTSCVKKQDCQKADKLLCLNGSIARQTYNGDCNGGVCSFSERGLFLETDCPAMNGTCVEGLIGDPKCDTGATYCGTYCNITLDVGAPRNYVINDKILEFELMSAVLNGNATIELDGNPVTVGRGKTGELDDVIYYVSFIRNGRVHITVDASGAPAYDQACGNGVCGLVEQDRNNLNYCPDDCGAVCGDARLTGAEQCDDNNTVSGDGCSSTCQLEGGVCGDSVCTVTEQMPENADYCPDDCGAVCGDNRNTHPEQCDDGNTVSGDGCSSTCQIESPGGPVCGNNIVEIGEECDEGPAGGTNCTGTCQWITTQCSDSLDNDGDGLIDYPYDPGCMSMSDNDETDTPTNITNATVELEFAPAGDEKYKLKFINREGLHYNLDLIDNSHGRFVLGNSDIGGYDERLHFTEGWFQEKDQFVVTIGEMTRVLEYNNYAPDSHEITFVDLAGGESRPIVDPSTCQGLVLRGGYSILFEVSNCSIAGNNTLQFDLDGDGLFDGSSVPILVEGGELELASIWGELANFSISRGTDQFDVSVFEPMTNEVNLQVSGLTLNNLYDDTYQGMTPGGVVVTKIGSSFEAATLEVNFP